MIMKKMFFLFSVLTILMSGINAQTLAVADGTDINHNIPLEGDFLNLQRSHTLYTDSTSPATLPYFCDFEDVDERNAWQFSNGNYVDKWYIGTAVSNGGDYSLYISHNGGVSNSYVGTTSYVWAYRDIYLNPSDSSYSLSFDIRSRAAWASIIVPTEVYLGPPAVPNGDSIPDGVTTLETNLYGISNWTTKTYSIDHSHAGLQRLYFFWRGRSTSMPTDPPPAIDNIIIEGAPCPNIPSELSELAMDTLAYLSWDLPNGSADYYTIAYKAVTDTVFSYITAQSEQFALGNLTPSTSYVWKVRAHCHATEFSCWSAASTFQTTENTARIPYLCDFEDAYENSGWIFFHGYIHGSPTDKWVIGSAVNHGGDSSLYVSKDNGATNSYQIQDEQIWACRDIYFDPSYSDYMISFDCRAQGQSYGDDPADYAKMFIGPPTTPNTAFHYNPVIPQDAFQIGDVIYLDSNWHNISVHLDSTFAGLQRLYILWYNNMPWARNPAAAFDNIVINGSRCPNIPTNLTVHPIDTMANLSWSAPNGNADSYTIAYKSQNDTAFTYITTQEESFSLGNLPSATTFVWKVRAHCNATESSFWSDENTFQTTANTARLPYYCDFEDSVENNRWVLVNATYGSSVNNWYIGNAVNNGGNASLYVSNNNGATNTYSFEISNLWAYRDIYFDSDSSRLHISFDCRAYGEKYNNQPVDYAKVFIGPPVTSSIPQTLSLIIPSGAIQIGDVIYLDSNWRNITLDLDSSFVGPQRLYFLWTSDYSLGTNPPAAIDNIMIYRDNDVNTCAAPHDLMVTATSTDSIRIRFTPTAEEDLNWQAVIVESDQPLDTTQIIALTDTCYTFNNLQDNTAYTIYVRTDCGDTQSEWCSITQWTDSLPACPPPTDVVATPISHDCVVIDWQPGGSEISWNVKVVLSGDSLNTSAHRITDSHPIIIGDLMAETSYLVYVQSNYEYSSSSWSLPVSFVTLPDGVDAHDMDHLLLLYPNPTNGKCTVVNEQYLIVNVEVYDMFGKRLETLQINDYQIDIDLSPFVSGVYFVRVTTEQGMAIKRVVKR